MKKTTLMTHGFLMASLLLAGAAFPTVAGTLPATEMVKKSFDGEIHNNTLAISPNEKLAVVARSGQPEVIVYDLTTGKVSQVLKHYITPRNIVFAPDGGSFYISDSSLGLVERVDATTFKAREQYAVGPGAFGTVLSKDGKTLYINNQASNAVISMNTETKIANAVITGFSQPRQGVRLSPDGRQLYVTNFVSDKITVVDTATDKITGEIGGFNKIRAISITADGKTLFAANSGNNTLSVVNLTTGKVTDTIPVGQQPYGAALSPDGKFVYSGNLADNSVSVVDVPTHKVTTTLTGFNEPRQAIVFTRDNRYAYVLNKDLSLSKIDRGTQRIVSTLKR
ncbi:beta-propeller fold lactonase family protein [Serratia rubidaea]|uniref:YncE family protein n=1 Tax=Serratia rubidaea TaxID=61652 RepID=UPI001F436DEC|nr:beta-propeller fold lactonase family protein [Serratia rubidaea]UJD79344.1 beta-propeller fold lactonase family protein [Serratia rubidaea]UJD83898.1 beta-propeller fold lactonase family protein [Serratia rubidaea]